MSKKNLVKVLACVLSASYLLATNTVLTVSANETIGNSDTNTQVFVLNEENVAVPYGRSRPSISNVRDLSDGSYISVIQEMSHLVYTNCCFTVTNNNMYVSISGDELKDYIEFNLSEGYYSYYIKFTLYEYDNALSYHIVDSYQVTPLPTGSVVGHRFLGLDNNAKYFVKIEKSVDHTTLHFLGLTIKSM